MQHADQPHQLKSYISNSKLRSSWHRVHGNAASHRRPVDSNTHTHTCIPMHICMYTHTHVCAQRCISCCWLPSLSTFQLHFRTAFLVFGETFFLQLFIFYCFCFYSASGECWHLFITYFDCFIYIFFQSFPVCICKCVGCWPSMVIWLCQSLKIIRIFSSLSIHWTLLFLVLLLWHFSYC